MTLQNHNYPKEVRRSISSGQKHSQGYFPSLPTEIEVDKWHFRYFQQFHRHQARAFEILNVFLQLHQPCLTLKRDHQLGNVYHHQQVFQTIFLFFVSAHGIYLSLSLFPPLISIEYRFYFEGNYKIYHEHIEQDRVMVNNFSGLKLIHFHKQGNMEMSPNKFLESLYQPKVQCQVHYANPFDVLQWFS